MTDDPGTRGRPDDPTTRPGYLDEVRREIDDEVRRRRASGDLPPYRRARARPAVPGPLPPRRARRGAARHAPARRRVGLHRPRGARRVASPGGTTVKRGLRSLSLWYLRYVTHQVSEFATAVSRALHVLDAQVTDLRRKVDALAVPPSVRGRGAWAHHTGGVVGGVGRRRHSAAGVGRVSCTRRAETGGSSARSWPAGWTPTASTPAPGAGAASSTRWTCASRTSVEHVGAVASGSLHASCCRAWWRARDRSSGPGSSKVRCAASPPAACCSSTRSDPASWAADDAPLEADMAPARPYRPADMARACSTTWASTPRSSEGPTVATTSSRAAREVAAAWPNDRGGRADEGRLRDAPLRRRGDGGSRVRRPPTRRAPGGRVWMAGRGLHDLRARPHHLGRRAARRRQRPQRRDRSTGSRRASGRVPEFYELDGRLRMAPARGEPRAVAALARAQRAGHARTWSARCAESDAEVVAFYPYLYYPTVVGMEAVDDTAGAASRRPRRACAVPQGVRRHLRRRRRHLLPHRGRTPARATASIGSPRSPRSSWAWGSRPSSRAGGRAGRSSASGTVPTS